MKTAIPANFPGAAWLTLSLLLAGCHAGRPGNLGARDGRLADCPASPNCVSSQSPDEAHRIAPLPFSGSPAAAMARLAAIVGSLPRATVITSTETYLHAEFRSAVFRFVDDAEFLLDEGRSVVQIRSASRLGSYDFGANRRRTEAIRARWGELAPR